MAWKKSRWYEFYCRERRVRAVTNIALSSSFWRRSLSLVERRQTNPSTVADAPLSWLSLGTLLALSRSIASEVCVAEEVDGIGDAVTELTASLRSMLKNNDYFC